MKHINDYFRAAVLMRNCNPEKWLALTPEQRTKLVNVFLEQRNKLLDEAYVISSTQYKKPLPADDLDVDLSVDFDEMLDKIEATTL